MTRRKKTVNSAASSLIRKQPIEAQPSISFRTENRYNRMMIYLTFHTVGVTLFFWYLGTLRLFLLGILIGIVLTMLLDDWRTYRKKNPERGSPVQESRGKMEKIEKKIKKKYFRKIHKITVIMARK